MHGSIDQPLTPSSTGISFPEQDVHLISVGRFDSRSETDEHALVVLAMGLECAIIESPSGEPGYEVLAERGQADAIRDEFAAYAREKEEPVREKPDFPVFRPALELAILWVTLVFIAFDLQDRYPGVTERFSNFNLAVFDQGQWWRPFTALFLHGDAAHLLGNVLYGLVLFPLVAHSLGPRTGWLLILASGFLGNLASGWVHYPDPSRSLGASTSTFGAIGILAGFSTLVAWRSRSYRRLGGVIVPVGAGIVLLGWLGAGDAPTDVLGHLLGFLSGCVFGAMRGREMVRGAVS